MSKRGIPCVNLLLACHFSNPVHYDLKCMKSTLTPFTFAMTFWSNSVSELFLKLAFVHNKTFWIFISGNIFMNSSFFFIPGSVMLSYINPARTGTRYCAILIEIMTSSITHALLKDEVTHVKTKTTEVLYSHWKLCCF